MTKTASYLALIILSLVLFIPGVMRLPVIDRDEAHFAQASRQMMETGNYFQIRFQDITRFQKPPGINWLQAGSVKLLSNTESSSIWMYRIPSVMGALLSVLLLFYFARRFINSKTAWLASALLASSLLLVVETQMAVIDASLLSSVLLMQGALWVLYTAGIEGKKSPWPWAMMFWLAMAYGLALKGVTPLVGLLSVVTLCVWERRVDWLRNLRLFSGAMLFAAVTLAWVMLVNEAEHSNYLMQMIHKDLLPKLQGGHESHGKPPLFHFFLLPLTFWPASLFLWQAGVHAFRHRSERLMRFLLAWIIPTWIFFELMPTKLPQYILPTFPAIALLCALAISSSNAEVRPSKWLHVLQFLWGVMTVGLALSLVVIPYLLLGRITGFSVFVASSIIFFGLACAYFAWQGKFQQAFMGVIVTAVVAFPLIFSGLFPQLKPLWISRNVAELVDKNKLSAENPLLAIGFSEPSLVFYLKTHGVQFINLDALAGIKTKNSLILMDEKSFGSLPNKETYSHLAHTQGYNYNKGKWIDLLLLKPG